MGIIADRQSRFWLARSFFCCSLVWVACCLAANIAFAQADDASEFGDPPAAAANDTPAAAEPTSPTAPSDSSPSSPPADIPVPQKSLLSWTFDSLGLFWLVVYLAISFTFVSLFVMSFLATRRDAVLPPELVEGFEQLLNERQFQEAYDLARSDESVLGQVLSAGMSKISRGYQKAMETMEDVIADEGMKLDQRLSYISLIGNLCPMVGLLGTVQGMIASFRVISTSGATPKPAELAGGISTAMFTTLVALAIAIPALATYNILRNRLSRLMVEVGMTSETLMSRFDDNKPQTAKKTETQRAPSERAQAERAQAERMQAERAQAERAQAERSTGDGA